MQLIYLYIEKYKNIQKQGFNFSPKYTCKYDHNDNFLDIKENKEYIDIFPNNIDITAIVGENGSGKSTIQKFILYLIFYNKYKNLKDLKYDASDEYNKYLKKEHMQHTNIGLDGIRGFLLIKKGDMFYKLSLMIDSYVSPQQGIIIGIAACLNDTQIHLLDIEDIDFFSIHFNYMIDTLKDSEEDEFIDEIYHRADSYETPILLEPYKFNNGKEEIDIKNLDYLSQQKFANIFRLNIKNNFIEKFFNPNLISLKINIKKILNKVDKLSKAVVGNHLMRIDNKHPIKVGAEHIFRYTNPFDIRSKIHKLYENKEYDKLNKIYLALKLLEKDYHSKFKELSFLYNAFFVSNNSQETIDNTIKAMSNIQNLEYILHSGNIPEFEIQKILNALKFNLQILNTDLIKVFEKYINQQKTDILNINQLLEYIPPWVDIEYFEDDKSYKSLSSGEKAIYSFMINLIYQVNNIKDTRYKTINIFLDETELGLHPQWQKEYLQSIILSLKSFDIKINLVFATHSPFILSDIPKENIIFLEDGENVSDDVDINTFGANIHTLLSHGFFMKDGLMGEFARDEIEKVIKFLNGDKNIKLKKIKAWNIIQKIGEPFLKMKLEEMYANKFKDDISVLDKIRDLKSQIKRLKYD